MSGYMMRSKFQNMFYGEMECSYCKMIEKTHTVYRTDPVKTQT